jgi:hypothetical protein
MTDPTPMTCEKCRGPITRGKGAVLTEEEKKTLQVAPGRLRVGLFKHADPRDCQKPDAGS